MDGLEYFSVLNLRNKVWDFLDGKDISDWLRRIGVKCWWNNDVLEIQGKVRTAIYRDLDPVSCYTALAFGIFGAFWIFILKDDYEKLNKEWKEKVKGEKRKGKREAIIKKVREEVSLL